MTVYSTPYNTYGSATPIYTNDSTLRMDESDGLSLRSTSHYQHQYDSYAHSQPSSPPPLQQQQHQQQQQPQQHLHHRHPSTSNQMHMVTASMSPSVAASASASVAAMAMAMVADDSKIDQKSYHDLELYEYFDPWIPAEEEEDSPYFEVRAAVSNTDDPSMPSLTFRVWAIGIIGTIVLAFANQVMWLRTVPIMIGTLVIQIASYPFGTFMAYSLPKTQYQTFGYKWSFNPGSFTIKEHALITIMGSAAIYPAYGLDVVAIRALFYDVHHKVPDFWPSLLVIITSQMVGYGLAGICRQLLIYPASMIWPANLASIVMYRTFHEQSNWTGISRTKMFWSVFGLSFIWYWVPGYLIKILSNLALLCYINRDSKLFQNLFDGYKGFALLNITIDWNVIANSYLGSPIVSPIWAIANIFAGFVILYWVIAPALFFSNTWRLQDFPVNSSKIYYTNGSEFQAFDVMNNETIRFDPDLYKSVGPVRLPIAVAIMYFGSFAILSSLISYTALYHGQEIRARLFDAKNQPADIHMKLMRKYQEVPVWWYASMYFVSLGLAIMICEVWHDMFAIRWYMMLFAMCIPLIFIIPVGIVQAVTNQQPGLNVITELIYGFIEPGNPLSNSTFKVYGYITMAQALALVSDLKLGHYMKIPPRHMFIVQSFGTVLAGLIQLVAFRIMMSVVPDVCRQEGEDPQWNCNSARLFYTASILWGAVAPQRSFLDQEYGVLFHGFWIGLLLPIPIYILQRYSSNHWLHSIHIPVMLSATNNFTGIPPSSFLPWLLVGLLFNYYLKRFRPSLWERYAFCISAGLDAGTIISGMAVFAVIQTAGNLPDNWAGNSQICKFDPKAKNKNK